MIREARRRLDAEERGPAPIPDVAVLRERLARPRERTPYRVKDWQLQGQRVMLAAQQKAGKTTVRDNLVRCLVDGDDFLGQYAVTPVVGTVVVLDFEMSESPSSTTGWASNISATMTTSSCCSDAWGRLQRSTSCSPDVRAEWAALLRRYHVEYPVVDCLRPILDALGLDEHKDAGRFLVAFDALLAEAGVSDALVVQHMGHLGERARGDSRLRDWPDVEWRLVRQDDNPRLPEIHHRLRPRRGRARESVGVHVLWPPADGGRRFTARCAEAAGARRRARRAERTDVWTGYLGRLPRSRPFHTPDRPSEPPFHRSASRPGPSPQRPARVVPHCISAPVRHSAPPVRQITGAPVRQCL